MAELATQGAAGCEESVKVVYAKEVDVPNAWQRLSSSNRDPSFQPKRLTIVMRCAQFLFGLLSVAMSTGRDIPAVTRFSVKADQLIIIDAGLIESLFHFPAYVYLTVVAIVTMLGAVVFTLTQLVDMALVGGSSEHESIRFTIDNNIPFVALCFDFIFLVLSMTSACAVLGLTDVMLDALNSNPISLDGKVSKAELVTVFHFKYAAAALMVAQSVCITATLYFGWKHVEERRKQMARLQIPPQVTQKRIDRLFRFWDMISSGLAGKRQRDRADISPLFLNRVFQVLLSMSAFVCCYILISGPSTEVAFSHVPPFQVLCWISLSVLIISTGIAAVSVVDLSLTGGAKPHPKEDANQDEEGGAKGSDDRRIEATEYKGIFQSSGSRFTEYLIYSRVVYDAIFSLLTFCVFSASAGVTSAELNCSASSSWCSLSVLSVFFMFLLSLSFMTSLFTGSITEFSELRTRIVSLQAVEAKPPST